MSFLCICVFSVYVFNPLPPSLPFPSLPFPITPIPSYRHYRPPTPNLYNNIKVLQVVTAMRTCIMGYKEPGLFAKVTVAMPQVGENVTCYSSIAMYSHRLKNIMLLE